MTRIAQSPRGLLNHACVLAALASSALAQQAAEQPTRLEAVVVSASRTPQDPKNIPSSVTMLPMVELQEAQITSLQTALNLTPGVLVLNNGATGSQGTLYLRGGSSSQSLIVVDGIRASSRQSDFYMRSILGNLGLNGLDRVEVLRGPQGTLYGSSAMGGVLVMETTHGCSTPVGRLGVELGSHNTWNLAGSYSGGTQDTGYSVAFSREATDNDQPHNRNRALNFSTRLERLLTEHLLLGITYRGNENDFETTGSRQWPSLGNSETSGHLATAYLAYNTDTLRSRATFGWNQVAYDYSDAWGLSRYLNTRQVFDWQNSWTASEQLTLVGGVTAEWAHFMSTSLSDRLESDTQGVYFNANYSPVAGLNLLAGGRYDAFSLADNKGTWRTGASYYVKPTATKLRATFGTAYAVPGMTERYGDNTWYVENPDIRPETCRGWDIGFDQELFNSRVVWESSFFRNTFRDMIVAEATPEWLYKFNNVARAHTQGWENAFRITVSDAISVRLSYTYMDVINDETAQRVVYKPRHNASADLLWKPAKGLVLGGGVHFVADRLRATNTPIEDYTTVRFHASWELHKDLLVKVRAENALDENYDDTYGYAGRSASVYGGVEYRF